MKKTLAIMAISAAATLFTLTDASFAIEKRGAEQSETPNKWSMEFILNKWKTLSGSTQIWIDDRFHWALCSNEHKSSDQKAFVVPQKETAPPQDGFVK